VLCASIFHYGTYTVAEAKERMRAAGIPVRIAEPAARFAALTFVFVGAGYAGIEALGELEDLARDALRLYPSLAPEDMRWLMVDAAPAILPELGETLGRYAQQELARSGVEIITNAKVAACSEDGVRLGGPVCEPLERFRAVRGELDLVALELERTPQRLAHGRLVVHDQDAHRGNCACEC